MSILTDFGQADAYAGILEGVIARIAPQARVLHLSHGVPRQSVEQGALMLAESLPFLPAGVHLAVVDPGVGSERRAIALRVADGRLLVGPDNGLLIEAAEVCGGVAAAHELQNERLRLAPLSQTFHGRDVFAPATAHLANGTPLEELGQALEPEGLVRLAPFVAAVGRGQLSATCLLVDGFGNCSLGAGPRDLDAAGLSDGVELRVLVGGVQRALARRAATFASVPPGSPLVYVDSRGRAAIGVRDGDAAALLGATPGARVVLERALG